MSKVLFINACARPDSRTYALAESCLSILNGEVTTVDLYRENISPLDYEGIRYRNDCSAVADFSAEVFKYAREFATADVIVIAAPFWDLSFPSVLKIYLEAVTVSGITFRYSEEGRPVGLCKAKKLLYVTTSGGYIGENNYGFNYVKALAENFYGIDDTGFVSAEGLDIYDADTEKIMNDAKNKIEKIIER